MAGNGVSSYYHTIPNPDDQVVCPFDNVHIIRYKRLPYHLSKCQKNHPTMRLSTCPFNATHLVPEAELKYHMLKCPDRAQIERQAKDDSKNAGFNEVPSYFPDVQVPDGENWESEALSAPRIGVPASELAGIGYIKNLQGFKPAQKKQYYKNLLENKPEANAALVASMNSPSEQTAGGDDSDQPKIKGFTQQGSSRGRGRGALVKSQTPEPGKPGPSNAARPVARGYPANNDKELRKLRKKIAQIEELEEKLAEGQELKEEERIKLCLKDTLKVNLQRLVDAINQ